MKVTRNQDYYILRARPGTELRTKPGCENLARSWVPGAIFCRFWLGTTLINWDFTTQEKKEKTWVQDSFMGPNKYEREYSLFACFKFN